jgi:hypothetical protein
MGSLVAIDALSRGTWPDAAVPWLLGGDQELSRLFWAMLWYFLSPLLAMLLAIHAVSEPAGWSAASGWRQMQWVLALIYSITNAAHLVADIRIPDSRSDQVFLMLVLTLVGLLLNLETWLWWKA